MEDIKVGDKLAIHCYKHSGAIDRICDEAIVLEINENMLVCANDKVKLIENDGRVHRTNESAILFFYKNRWFNILGQLKKHGGGSVSADIVAFHISSGSHIAPHVAAFHISSGH